MNASISRRVFLKASAAGAGLAAVSSFSRSADAQSPAKKLVIAVMGTTSRGLAHIGGLLSVPNVEIGYVCDVDDRAIANGIKAAQAKQGKEPKGVKDFRKALEDKDVDALTIAAPNHWHAPAAILACAAGKHVCVEKPGSHNPHESELIIAAARKHQRVVQMGNQRRSMPMIVEGIAKLQAGVIGRLLTARCWYTRFRPTIGCGKAVPVPEWLDYTLWQGPAPDRPYRDNVLHYNWHWFWHWGNGELGNNGVHTLDLARWGLGVDRPRRVTYAGGRYLVQDDQESPDTGVAGFDFGDRFITWEQSSSHGRAAEKQGLVYFYGEGGMLMLGDSAYRIFDEKGKETGGNKAATEVDAGKGAGSEAEEHFANFCAAIRDGQPLNADIAEGQKATMLCHYGNIAWRTGRTVNVDPRTGAIIGDEQAAALWRREYRPGWEPAV